MNFKKSDDLLLIKKPTDTLIELTRKKAQETLDFKNTKSMDTFSLNPQLELEYEKIW